MKPHRTDGISLAFGLTFLGAALLWFVVLQVSLSAVVVGWFVVCGLFVLGALGLAHAITRATRRRDTNDEPPLP
jgi:hypothetical protein